MLKKLLGLGEIYTTRYGFSKNKGKGYILPKDGESTAPMTKNIGIGRVSWVEDPDGKVIIDGIRSSYSYVAKKKEPVLVSNVEILEYGNVRFYGFIENASEEYSLRIGSVDYGTITDSFDIIVQGKAPGQYNTLVEITGLETGTHIETWVEYEVEPYGPEIAPMTLRFAFSQDTTDPTTLEMTTGTWTRSSYPGYSNVWDFRREDDYWDYIFTNKFTSSFDPDVKLIQAGDTSIIISMTSIFEGCTTLTSVCLFDTSNIRSGLGMWRMFNGCSSLTSVPLFDTSNADSMFEMFNGCSSLTSVPLFDTHNVNVFQRTFQGCSSLTSVPLFDTHNVTTMESLFSGCSSLTSVPELDTSNVTDMRDMFSGCSSLTSVPELDTSNVTNMRGMLNGCSNIEIGMIEFFKSVTNKVTDTTHLFYRCGTNSESGRAARLKIPVSLGTFWKQGGFGGDLNLGLNPGLTLEYSSAVSDIAFDPALNVAKFYNNAMGYNNPNGYYLKINKPQYFDQFVLSSPAAGKYSYVWPDMLDDSAFQQAACVVPLPSQTTGIYSIDFWNKFDYSMTCEAIENITTYPTKFYNGGNLRRIQDLGIWNNETYTGALLPTLQALDAATPNKEEITEWFIEMPNISDYDACVEAGYGAWLKPNVPAIAPMTLRFSFSNPNSDPTTLGMTKGTWANVGPMTLDDVEYQNVWDWTYDNAVWDESFRSKLNSSFDPDVKVIQAGDTSNVTSIAYMFYDCTSLTSVPLFDTSNVTSIAYMFYDCTSLTSVPLFDIQNVTDLRCMFGDCTSLTSVPLFDTHNVTGMNSMFYRCSSLTSVPLFDTHNVTDMSEMFYYCSALTSIPLFDTSNVTDVDSMFYGCMEIQTGMLDLYNTASSTGNVTNYEDCFRQAGISTMDGRAERAQIPTSWGGDMEE